MSSGYPQQNLNSANGVQVKNETALGQKGGKIICLFPLVVQRGSMASSASAVDGEIENNKTVEETTKESFLEKIQAKFGDEVTKVFESKYFILDQNFRLKFTSFVYPL